MKLHTTLLAIALGSLVSTAAVAEGDDAVILSAWDMTNSIYITGDLFAEGTATVDSSSSAVVDQDQVTGLNLSFGDGDNDATVDDNALSGASGNIGANVAAGVGNVQANDAALSASAGTAVFASAMVFNSQLTAANGATDSGTPDNQLFFDATVTDDALADASGNIGLNVASGVGNAQSNALAASVNGDGNIAAASADSEQAAIFNILLAFDDLDNSATLSGNALSNAIGNIGVNVAAGMGNAQHNGLAIAVASCGTCD